MKSNLLLEKIKLYQCEYKSLLESLIQLDSNKISDGLDEVRLFWIRRIEAVQLYLRNWFPGENSYVFTASVHLDYDDNEHLPFLLFGTQHVLDDPLSRFAETYSNLTEENDIEFLTTEIVATAKDNLKLLDNAYGSILILPLQLLSRTKRDQALNDIAEKVFLKFFKGIESLEDFFSKCNSIDEIEQYALDNIGGKLLFSASDDISLSIKERFHTAIEKEQFIVNERKPDSFNFFMLVFGYLLQAIKVIGSGIEYGCVPYIRDPVVFHYILLLFGNMELTEHICTMRYKMSVAHIVYQICEKEKMAKACLAAFIKKCREYDFSSKLYQCLDEHGINAKNFYKFSIKDILSGELEKLYTELSDK